MKMHFSTRDFRKNVEILSKNEKRHEEIENMVNSDHFGPRHAIAPLKIWPMGQNGPKNICLAQNFTLTVPK